MDRRSRGSSIIELGSIASLLVVVAVFSANIGIIALGSGINDKGCRDAARAAAQASDYATGLKMAQAALAAHRTDGYFVTQPAIVTAGYVYEDYAGNAPANTSPYVSVTTSNQVRVPCPVLFFGAKFEPGGTVSFTRTYTFPIVRTTLYLN